MVRESAGNTYSWSKWFRTEGNADVNFFWKLNKSFESSKERRWNDEYRKICSKMCKRSDFYLLLKIDQMIGIWILPLVYLLKFFNFSSDAVPRTQVNSIFPGFLCWKTFLYWLNLSNIIRLWNSKISLSSFCHCSKSTLITVPLNRDFSAYSRFILRCKSGSNIKASITASHKSRRYL